MEFDTTTTLAAFVGVVGIGTAALIAAPMMTTTTVLTMVVPSMVLFGAVMLALGVKHGQFRTTR